MHKLAGQQVSFSGVALIPDYIFHMLEQLHLMKDLKLQKLDEDGFDIISFEGDDQLYTSSVV